MCIRDRTRGLSDCVGARAHEVKRDHQVCIAQVFRHTSVTRTYALPHTLLAEERVPPGRACVVSHAR
eukprot:5015107-Alexandrium_andersonii.AAC.1